MKWLNLEKNPKTQVLIKMKIFNSKILKLEVSKSNKPFTKNDEENMGSDSKCKKRRKK